MTTIHAQAERKRQDRSVCRAEKRLCRARMLRVRGLIHPTSAVCATTDTARGEKRLPSEQNQAILKSSGGPLGEYRLMTTMVLAAAGCASGPTLSPTIELAPSAMATLRQPYVTADSKGMKVSGWLCRRNLHQLSPRRVRVERLATSGQVIDAMEAPVARGHKSRCELYRVQTPWVPDEKERLRVCDSSRPGATCAPGRPG